MMWNKTTGGEVRIQVINHSVNFDFNYWVEIWISVSSMLL